MKEQDAQNYEGELTFWDHLEVLRWALVRIAGVLVVITIFTFMAMPYIFDQYIKCYIFTHNPISLRLADI